MFASKSFTEAIHCFSKANRPELVALSYAFHLENQAETMVLTSPKQDVLRRQAYEDAANAFLACPLHEDIEREVPLQHAGDCFLNAKRLKDAACAYLSAGLYEKATLVFRQGEMFDEAVDVIKRHRQHISNSVVDEIMDVARLYFLKSKFKKDQT
jgi:hypothetical protein